MPETAEQIYARCRDALVMPPLADWDTMPFTGDITLRRLEPPVAEDHPRDGVGGIGCRGCHFPDSAYVWTNDRWRLGSLPGPTGMPVVLILEPRAHFAEPGDLPDEVAVELGLMLVRIERAIRGIGEIGRVHVCRWGDGGEHLHWWFIARPSRLPQIYGSFCEIWDEVLPPTPEDVWRDNIRLVVEALNRDQASW